MKPELPPLDLTLTPQDRDRCAIAKVHIERNRRMRNREDAKRERLAHEAQLLRALYGKADPA